MLKSVHNTSEPSWQERLRRWFHDSRRFLAHFGRQIIAKGCQKSAAALTYMTLFAIVPLMTVVYSMFSLIPAFKGMGDTVQSFIFTNLVPSAGQEVQTYLAGFSEQARNLTFVGAGMLLITSYLMLKNIEKTFNAIWDVADARSGLQNFLLYWAVLSLGPLCLGIGLAMSTYLLSLRLLVGEYDSLGLLPQFLQFFPWVLTSAAFTLLYLAVPNCKVRFRDAALGGMVTAFCFEVTKDVFTWIVGRSSFELIYGAFAVVPLFLLWINILWMIVLGGAVLVRSLGAYQAELRGSPYPPLIAALRALWVLKSRGQKKGLSVYDIHMVQSGIAPSQWRPLRKQMIESGLMAETHSGKYVLTCDLDDITLNTLAEKVDVQKSLPSDTSRLRALPWFVALEERMSKLEAYRHELQAVSVAELFAQTDASESIVDTAATSANKDLEGTH